MAQRTYLLTWNPRKFAWDDFEDDWNSILMGYQVPFQWSCGNTKAIKPGDRIFLMRLGKYQGINGIICSGWVTSHPFEESHWDDEYLNNTALYVEFTADVLLNPTIDTLLDPVVVSQNFNWYPQRSGITIPQDIADELETLWQKHTHFYSKSSEKAVEDIYREGSRFLVSSYRYERNLQARKSCITHHGTTCIICGFNFGAIWGDLGEGFIHVHHLTPLSAQKTEYEIDPIEDLRPVCPNCHAMLHRRTPPYSIEELKERLQNRNE